jgi:hypothetical protein
MGKTTKPAAQLPPRDLPRAPHGLIFTHHDRVSDDLLAFTRS